LIDGGSILTLTYYGAEKWMPALQRDGRRQSGAGGERALSRPPILGEKNIRVNAIVGRGRSRRLAASGIGDFRYILKWNEYNAPMRRNRDNRGSRRQRTVPAVGHVARRPPARCIMSIPAITLSA